MIEIRSPCINLCVIEDEHCAGCLRTTGEIANWLFYSEKERDEVMVCLESRKRRKLD
jgi:predicted Fe-S protein YdhL (DUF1289 family)